MDATGKGAAGPVTRVTRAPAGRLPVGYGMVLGAASLWGTLGVLYKHILATYSVTPLGVAYLRALLAFAALLLALLLFSRRRLAVNRDDLPFLAIYGVVGVGVFYVVYAYAIQLTTVATAVVLLYTAPAFVTLMSWRLYGENLGRGKLLALSLTFGGCILVSRAYEPSLLKGNVVGILCGLASGFTYALYSVFGKKALGKYDAWTVLAYVLGFGCLFLTPFLDFRSLSSAAQVGGFWAWMVVVALFPTLTALALYMGGLERLPASVAAILCTWEPAVASLLAYLLLGEVLQPVQWAGAILILAGVVTLQRSRSG